MNKSKKLVFFGTEDFSVPSLQALIKSGWEIVAVVTKPDSPAGRGRRIHSPAVKLVAESNAVKVLQPDKVEEINQTLKDLDASAGVLVSYGKLLPKSTIDIFPSGIINVHPSLLPKYRGPSPIEAAILSDDTETGVSLMKLELKMDAGPVFYQERVQLNGSETRLQLQALLATLGANMLADKLAEIIEGKIAPKDQDESKATFTQLLKKDDGIIDWQEPATVIDKKIRAYAGYPKSRAKLFEKYDVVITKARSADAPSRNGLVVECKPGWLEITELIAPSGRVISGVDFLRGYRP